MIPSSAEGIAFAKHIPEFQAVVAFRRLGELRELAVAPVVVTAVHDHAADGSAMAADPLGGRFHHDVGAEFQGPYEIATGAESIVYDQGQVILFGQGHKFLEIGNVQPRVADGLQVDCFGALGDRRGKGGGIVAIHPHGAHAEAR